VKRLYAAMASALILVGLLPTAVSADRVSKFTDHYVFFGCDAPIDGGFVSTFIEHGTVGEFSFASLNVWLDPAVPMEEEPTIVGSTDAFDLTDDGTTIEAHAVIPTFDLEGNPEGDAELTITATRTGDIFVIGPDSGKTNYNSKTTGMEEGLDGSGTLTWDGSEYALTECGGVVADVNFFSTNPRGFVTDNQGTQIDCFWETDSGVASLFAVDDGFGFFADAFLSAGDLELSSFGESSGSVDSAGMDVEVELQDSATGDPHSATAVATFTPIGSPVQSVLTSEASQTRVTDQALEPVGTLDFSSGDSFPIEGEHCNSSSFDSHSRGVSKPGRQNGPAPVNDTPDGAIALHVGSRLNASNVAAALEPEIQLQDCPEGFFDQFGRTLWYTVEGTGSPITIDTAGSNFDTLIAVYVATDPGFVEIGCIDDVESDPVGATFQAALTFDTGEGVTYYVQIGGYDFPFDEELNAQKGRLRVEVR
jgi:hypothetical protein